jgi:hypothetical protein
MDVDVIMLYIVDGKGKEHNIVCCFVCVLEVPRVGKDSKEVSLR